MSDRKLPAKHGKEAPENKGDWPTASARVSPADSQLIDDAVNALNRRRSTSETKFSRSQIVEKGTMLYVKMILGITSKAA